MNADCLSKWKTRTTEYMFPSEMLLLIYIRDFKSAQIFYTTLPQVSIIVKYAVGSVVNFFNEKKQQQICNSVGTVPEKHVSMFF